MKRLFFLMVLLSAVRLVSAQQTESRVPPASQPSTAVNEVARTATAALAEKYTLNVSQQATLYRIQERKHRQLAEIEPLLQSDPERYRLKLQSVQKGALNSIERLLESPEQKELFRKTQMELRTLRSEKRRELQQSGLPASAIEVQVLQLYRE